MPAATRNLLLMVALLTTGTVSAAGDRLLFDNPDYVVTTAADNRYCEPPMAVTIETGNPDLFESDNELQRIVDGARSVLAYECPEIRAVEVRGRLTGISEPVFKGVADARADWQLDTRQSFESRAYGEHGEEWRNESGEARTAGEFNVASLQAGMTVSEVMSTVQETFGVEPTYDERKGVLHMQAGGCREGYDWKALSPLPQPGWKCLRAWFTDQRVERLYLVELIQVVEGDQVEDIDAFLTDQFGQPVQRRGSNEEQEWWRNEPAQYTLAWGDVVSATPVSENGEQAERYTLQAHITPVEDVTILSVTLYQPDVRPGRAARAEPPDLDLNL